MQQIFFRVLLLGLAFVTIPTLSAAERKPWTYLFYIAGDEAEIDAFSRVPIRKLEQVGSDANKWIIAQTDFHFDEKGIEKVSEPSQRYVIAKHPGPINAKNYATLKIQSPSVWASAGEMNSGGPEALNDFIRWGMANYPADHYAVFILGHAWGWRGMAQDYNPGFALPENPLGKDESSTLISLSELHETLKANFSHQKLDLLVLDACNMGLLEVVYELRGLVKTYVASTTEMPFMSFDYVKTFAAPVSSTEDFVKRLVGENLASFARGGWQAPLEGDYPGVAITAIDVARMESFWKPWIQLAHRLSRTKIHEHFSTKQWWDFAGYAQIGNFLRHLAEVDAGAFAADANSLLALLGEPNTPSPDGELIPISSHPFAAFDQLHLVIEADEILNQEKSLEAAESFFDHINPLWAEIEKKWEIHDREGQRTAEVRIRLPNGALPTATIRPFIAGARWARIETLKSGKLVQTKRVEQPQTHYLRTEFPAHSPYVITGHTSGAVLSEGLVFQLDDRFEKDLAENYRWVNGKWIGAEEYYRSLNFSRETGWGGGR